MNKRPVSTRLPRMNLTSLRAEHFFIEASSILFFEVNAMFFEELVRVIHRSLLRELYIIPREHRKTDFELQQSESVICDRLVSCQFDGKQPRY